MKKILSLILVVLLMMSVMVSCDLVNTGKTPDNGSTTQQQDNTTRPKDDPVTPEGPTTTLDDAAGVLDAFYKANNGAVTSSDWEVVTQILVGSDVFTVSWNVDNSAITIRDNAAGTMKLIDLPETNPTEVTYTLVAVIKDAAGQTKTVTYTRVLPVLNSTSGGNDTNVPGENETPATLDDAEILLNSLYKKDNGAVTSDDWEVVKQVKSGSDTFTIEWSVDNAAITIKDNADGTMKVIDLPETNATEITYTLVAVIKNAAGQSKTVSYTRVLPVLEPAPDQPGDNTALYTDFTDDEKAAFLELFGEVIPFVSNNEYYVEEYSDTELGEAGLNFYAFGNTQAEFDAYLEKFSSYTLVRTYEDSYGDAWYSYQKGDFYVDLSYYSYDSVNVIDVYAYVLTDDSTGGETGGETGGDTDGKLYTDFTDDEKAAFTGLCGEVIPFVPNNEYYVEDYSDADLGEAGFHFYTIGNTQEEFDAYLEKFSSYTYVDSFEDTYGDTWYTYQKGDFYVDLSYYYYEWEEGAGDYFIDVYVYVLTGGGETGGETGGDTDGTLYTDFTDDEKAAFLELFGEVIPFVSNNEYYVEDYSDADLGEAGFNFYTIGNTQEEFDAYLEKFSSYAYVDSFEDTYGDTWYTYQKGDFYVDLSYYYYEWEEGAGDYFIDVYVYVLTDGSAGGGTGGTTTEPTLAGTIDFTDTANRTVGTAEQQVWEMNGITVTNDKANSDHDVNVGYSNPIRCYQGSDLTVAYPGMTKLVITCLSNLYGDDYAAALVATEISTGTVSFEGEIVTVIFDSAVDTVTFTNMSAQVRILQIDVYTGGNGNASGGSGSGSGSGSDTTAPDTLITNDGKGLPTGTNGVYDVCFDDATNVKDVTDQGYYMDGCPTTGSPAVLVIPVDFSDFQAATLGYDIDVIKQAFLQNGETDYHSVYDYYYASSYGKLTLDITVLDFWFRPQYASTYYESVTADYYGQEYEAGDQMIINEALAYLDTKKGMDLSQFDSDNNGVIDSIVLITSLEIGEDNFHWAYRYWNLYTDADGYYYEYDGVSANDYLWASYQFLHESYDASGNVTYDDTSVLNTYTYIHEFGHILGADDYYDTAYVGSPMGGCDIMDAMTGDHNAYTKFNLGWIDTSRLVTTDSSVTLTLEDFSQNGDTILLANNWDPDLGAYQEYYIVVYYRNTGLNAGDAGYFSRDGIVVYHVNASLYSEEYEGETYYDVYYNNTDPSDSYGTAENLIEFVKHLDGEEEIFTYVAGDSLPAVTDDSGNALGYTFTVDSLVDGTATLTFTKLAA